MRSRGWSANSASAIRWLIAAAVVVLLLAAWPGASRPFSTPKLWLIGILDLLAILRCVTGSERLALPPWPWLALIAAVSLSAITAPFLSPAAFLVFVIPLPLIFGLGDVSSALCVASALESAIALLQFAGYDPFLWLGWVPEGFASSRMRIYGTLGNPDFVAAWLSATLPFSTVVRRRSLAGPLIGLQVAAIFCTGSRVLLVALPAALLACAVVNRKFEKWWLLSLPLLGAIVWFSPARPLGTTAQGRLHLAGLTAAHVDEVPVTGYGPGAFELQFAGWQRAWRAEQPLDRRFLGPVDHAHNDYLEFWVEYGPPGLAAFLAVCGSLLWRVWRRDLAAEVAAALSALLAIAIVDFPFHRPAEWALFIILLSLKKET